MDNLLAGRKTGWYRWTIRISRSGRKGGFKIQLPSPASDVRSQVVARVLSSTSFERAPRLRSFLRFVCECELSGKRDQINEHAIGVEVFGRQSAYNPSEDSIVRSQARLLRQRLEEYYRTEGAHEELRITIPKGGYLPTFETVLPPLTSIDAGVDYVLTSPTVQVTARPPIKPVYWGIGLLCLLLALAGAVTARRFARPAGPAAQERLWSNLFNDKRRAIIVPADSTLILIEALNQKPVHLQEYISRQYLASNLQQPGLAPLKDFGLGDSQYTSIADLNLVSEMMRTIGPARDHAEIRYARDLSVTDAKQNNLILIGGARANPWVELFASQMNLYVDFDWKTRHNVVINKQPAPGQPPIYSEDASDPAHRVYGLIAFLPGLDSESNMLLIAGTSTTGTEAAADFLLNPSNLDAFLNRINPSTGEMPHFEMLLESRSIAEKSPQSKVIAYRILP